MSSQKQRWCEARIAQMLGAPNSQKLCGTLVKSIVDHELGGHATRFLLPDDEIPQFRMLFVDCVIDVCMVRSMLLQHLNAKEKHNDFPELDLCSQPE